MQFDGKEEIVKDVQRLLGIKDDGVDGPVTWGTIKNKLSNGVTVEGELDVKHITPTQPDILSQKSIDLILKHEVGGGESYYNKFLKKPTWPGGASGVTIGIGYDLGYNTLTQFEKDWKGKISNTDFNLLNTALGVRGSSASNIISRYRNIEIPWEVAFDVYKQSTLPRFIGYTKSAFPKSEELCPDAFGALVSLVFNRGASMSGSTRTEMANIRPLVLKKDYRGIAAQIRSMKRLWVGKGLDGLLRRRDEEAALVESCA